jgi:DNA-binding GntR family transcriptional regulator
VKELERLLDQNTPNPQDRLRIDNGLHAYWVTCAANRYIMDFFTQHSRYYAALFDYATLTRSIVEEMAAQHREILEALMQGQQARARKFLRQHIRAQRPNITELLELAAGDQPD